jgi:hypothetical protein
MLPRGFSTTQKCTTRQHEMRSFTCFSGQNERFLARAHTESQTELVFNLDKVGMSEWEDEKDKEMIGSKAIEDEMIHHRASQNVRHISIITDTTAGEESITSYTVASQDSERVRRRVVSRVRFRNRI